MTEWLKRLTLALLGATVAALLLSVLETQWVRAPLAEPPGYGPTYLLTLGLLVPPALVVGGAMGLAALWLHPSAAPSTGGLNAWLVAGDALRQRRLAVTLPLFGLALVIWLIAIVRIALRLLAADLPAAPAGAAMSLSALLVGVVVTVIAAGSGEALARRLARAPFAPLAGLSLAVIIVVVFVAAVIAAGTTSGAGHMLAVFGVFKRPELDLRPVLQLFVLALGAYLMPALARRLPLLPALVISALPLAVFAYVLSSGGNARTALAIERGAALSKVALGLVRKLSDGDKDGFSARLGGGDCNDTDPRINPAVEDVPGNAIDEDCSGVDAKPVSLTKSAAAAPASTGSSADKLPKKPNVLLITIDTLRYDLGYMGNPRPLSPNIDALAKRGAVFERGYALASYTSKSLPPMMIGKYTSETQRGWAHFNRFGKQETFVQERLQRAGIRTLSVQGYWYFFNPGYGFERGFDVIDSSAAPATPAVEGDRSFNSHKLTDAAIAQLSKSENTDRQFFLWVHYVDPHSEYAPHEEFNFGKTSRDAYDGEVAFVDKHVGRLLDHVKASPFGERTVVLLTSDHGEAFGEHGMIRHGFEVWEELVRVPLIVHVPGAEPRRIREPRSIVDVVPTILETYGLPAPSGEGTDFVSGTSLLPDVLGPADRTPESRIVFVDMSAGPHNAERQAFIEGNMKLIATGGRPLGLYDLAADPGEKRDLLDNAELKETTVARYRAFRKQLREVVVRPQ